MFVNIRDAFGIISIRNIITFMSIFREECLINNYGLRRSYGDSIYVMFGGII